MQAERLESVKAVYLEYRDVEYPEVSIKTKLLNGEITRSNVPQEDLIRFIRSLLDLNFWPRKRMDELLETPGIKISPEELEFFRELNSWAQKGLDLIKPEILASEQLELKAKRKS